MAATDRRVPAPQPNPETQPYWDAAAQGRLLIRRCTECREPHHYPRAMCPFCFSAATVWEATSGQAKIYSFSMMRRAPVPYAIAYVTLAEGPTLMTNLVDCAFDSIRIGQAMRLVFRPSEGGPPVPMFAPA